MISEVEHDTGPGEFKYSSVVYVWNDTVNNRSLALHITTGAPSGDLSLGPFTRCVYHTLETINAIPESNGFVMLHFLPDTLGMDVTMLPVGDNHTKLDTELKGGDGFRVMLDQVVTCCELRSLQLDTVRILYNDPADIVSNHSEVAIVHELNVSIVNNQDIAGFLAVVANRT